MVQTFEDTTIEEGTIIIDPESKNSSYNSLDSLILKKQSRLLKCNIIGCRIAQGLFLTSGIVTLTSVTSCTMSAYDRFTLGQSYSQTNTQDYSSLDAKLKSLEKKQNVVNDIMLCASLSVIVSGIATSRFNKKAILSRDALVKQGHRYAANIIINKYDGYLGVFQTPISSKN